MKIERYFSVLVILMAGLFLVNASWPEPTFAASRETKVKSAQKADMRSPAVRINPIKPSVRVAQAQAPTVPTCVQCWNVPVNTWNVPATRGGTGETLNRPPAALVAPAVPVTSAPGCPVVTPPDTPWGLLGTILQAPFVLGQCIFGACPAPGC